jgi:hypothetical protein
MSVAADVCRDAEASEAETSPALSVILPTVHAWPAVLPALTALLTQETTHSFEILLADGNGAALAEPSADPRVRWLRLPGRETFTLRAAGVAAARGKVIAITEDHCLVPPTWAEAIVAAHDADRTPALIGATVNHPDSSVSAIDRANFLLTFAGQTGVRLDVTPRRLPVPTNVSFKREALPAAGLRPGALEYEWLMQMRESRSLGVARRVVLEHRQCWGAAAPAVHWASGRSYGASVRAWPWREKLAWWLKLPLLPLRIARVVLPDLLQGAGGTPLTAADILCMATLIAANVCGQVHGALCGPGASRHRL